VAVTHSDHHYASPSRTRRRQDLPEQQDLRETLALIKQPGRCALISIKVRSMPGYSAAAASRRAGLVLCSRPTATSDRGRPAA